MDAHLFEDVVNMGTDGVRGEDEGLADVVVATATGQLFEYLYLSGREFFAQ